MATQKQIDDIVQIFNCERPKMPLRDINAVNMGVGAVIRYLHESKGETDVTAGDISEFLHVSTARVAVLLRKIELATLFPDMCEAVLSESIIGRARTAGFIEINCHNIRDYTLDKHNRVDDAPYGGGMGMLMQAQPIYDCYKAVCEKSKTKPKAIFMSPKGKTLTQEMCKELLNEESLFILCGHYEGVDQRVLDKIGFLEVSIGDYVLTGGELPALVLIDSVCRMVEGVLPSEECFTEESHYNGLLEYPQYSRPEVWEGMSVPEVLLSGHHANIEKWRYEQSLSITKERRPDMYERYILEHPPIEKKKRKRHTKNTNEE